MTTRLNHQQRIARLNAWVAARTPEPVTSPAPVPVVVEPDLPTPIPTAPDVPPPTDFGPLLKHLREQHRTSQSKLALAADFDHSYVSRLESGTRMPTREAVDRLAEAMQLDAQGRDNLLAAAGFLPRDIGSLIADEPVIGDLLDYLQDADVPVERRETMRGLLRLVAEQARYGAVVRMTTATLGTPEGESG